MPKLNFSVIEIELNKIVNNDNIDAVTKVFLALKEKRNDLRVNDNTLKIGINAINFDDAQSNSAPSFANIIGIFNAFFVVFGTGCVWICFLLRALHFALFSLKSEDINMGERTGTQTAKEN
jgi:hypothetical protein